ncbi:MAG: hypothetical protein QXX41_12720 [Nitrososphaerota archaeon]
MSVIIELKLPIDNSFTNLLLYEGVVYIIAENWAAIKGNKIEISSDIFKKVYKELIQGRLSEIRINFTGKNDKVPVDGFLKMLKISAKEKISNYGSLIELLYDNADKLKINKNNIYLQLFIDKNISIGEPKLSRENGVSLQLFKVERYTGLTSMELKYSDKQLTTYLSPEIVLIGLLGIYSSYVGTVREKNLEYYFLLFDSQEIAEIFSGYQNVKTIIDMKNKVRDELARIIGKYFSEELIIVEILVNIVLQEELNRCNIEKLSLILARIAHEGQTYKIYQLIPITVRRSKIPPEVLHEVISPDGVILSRMSRRENIEYNNLILAVNGLYRYVVLSDPQGLFMMIRELHNAYHKVLNDPKLKNIVDRYKTLLTKLSHLQYVT